MPEKKSNKKAVKKTAPKATRSGNSEKKESVSVTDTSKRNTSESKQSNKNKPALGKNTSGKAIAKKSSKNKSAKETRQPKSTNSKHEVSRAAKKTSTKGNIIAKKSSKGRGVLQSKGTNNSNSKAAGKSSKQQVNSKVSKSVSGKSVLPKSLSKKAIAKNASAKGTTRKKISNKALVQNDISGTVKRPPNRVFGNESRKYEEYIEPMLASLEDQPFDDNAWIFEMKWDGYRAIAEWNKKKLKLYSRNGLSFVQKYPPVADAVTKLKHDCVLDGEIVVLNEKGRPRFQMLQEYDQDPRHPIHYYVFDLLFLDGKDIRELPLLQRKELLQQFLKSYKGDVIRYSDHVTGSGKKFFHHVKKLDFEGMMAKKSDSEYYSGTRTRTREWLKIKHLNNQEAVIVGFTAPRRSRKYFGALILGEFKGRGLQYIGHTGTGFTQSKLKELWDLMQPLITTNSPFSENIKVNAPVTWIRPEIVCEVKFTEQTNEGILRHPVFLGLREDKAAQEVTQNNDR